MRHTAPDGIMLMVERRFPMSLVGKIHDRRTHQIERSEELRDIIRSSFEASPQEMLPLSIGTLLAKAAFGSSAPIQTGGGKESRRPKS